MDARLQLLSYSSLLTLHSCPRKFQLNRLSAIEQEFKKEVEDNQNTTFAFGHVVGEGIQNVLAGMAEKEVYLRAFLGWHAELDDENTKQMKSFPHAIIAIQKIAAMRAAGWLQDYEIMQFPTKDRLHTRPAVELGFSITFPDGFKLRGYVDAVLQNIHTGEILVLECKTSSATSLNQAMYKNSAQAIGYSIVLDALAPTASSYSVLYLIYKSKQLDYEQMVFNKSYLQRATWIKELLLDIDTIKLYEESGIYPMRGESCYSFYRECEYFNLCTLKTSNLVAPLSTQRQEEIAAESFDIEITLIDLLEAQLEKNRLAEEAHGLL